MSADLLTVALAREFAGAWERGVRILAITSLTTLVAGLVARATTAPGLAIAAGFGALDAEPAPSLIRGEVALGAATSPRGPSADTFVALARGRVGVAVTPAQLDGSGATNLFQVGGSDQEPGVALPGDRGLPENNDAPGCVWYVFPDHSARQLVAQVDSVSGPPPSPGRYRRLLTPLGVFELQEGWRAVALADGVTARDVAGATSFSIEVPSDVDILVPPSEQEQRALTEVDPLGCRYLEHASGEELARLAASIREAESSSA